MPNRIIREGWLESETINQLDVHAERFFFRLILKADDYGRYHAHPTLLKSNLFPLRDDVRGADITRWLAACEKAGLLRCYSSSGKPYLEIPKFGQRARADQSKFPEPPEEKSSALLPGIALSETTGKRPPPVRQLSDIRPSHDGPPRTYAETKSKQIQAPPASPPSQVRQASPLFQSIADVCGIAIDELGPKARKGIESALREIVAASPSVTPEEITARAASYRKTMPAGCRLTAHALAKHWATLDGTPPPPAAAAEPEGWRETLEKLFPGNTISSDPERTWASVDATTQAKVLNHGRAA